MFESGIKVTVKDRQVLYIYFYPMTYFDWVVYSNPGHIYEPAYIREIFKKYITRISIESSDREYTIYDLMEEEDAVKVNIIGKIVEKSGYSDDNALSDYVDYYKKQTLTIEGAYDTFILANTTFEYYQQMLHTNIHERAQIIAMLEKIKGFSVKERYDDAIKYGISVNLVDGPKDYDKWKEEEITRGQKLQVVKPQQSNNKQPLNNKIEAETGTDLTSLIESSKSALATALARDIANPRKYFDAMKDEEDYAE